MINEPDKNETKWKRRNENMMKIKIKLKSIFKVLPVWGILTSGATGHAERYSFYK